MFSDRFSGINGQKGLVRGKIGKDHGEGNGGMGRAFRGWKGDGTEPQSDRHGKYIISFSRA